MTSWNKGAERLLGYLAEEAVGRPVTILIPPARHLEEALIIDRIGAVTASIILRQFVGAKTEA